MNRTSASKRDAGFTLLELLVVIIIIGILAAIAIPVFLNQRRKAVDAQVKYDLRDAAEAAEVFTTDNVTSSASFSAAGLTASGFKRSTTSNDIQIVGSPLNGYCIRGANPSGTTDTTAGNYYWYDSKAGGMQGGVAGPAPAGGACASAVWPGVPLT